MISFEGIEGSGKTTQAQMLYEFLKSTGLPCYLSREPGGTEIGERIREILLDPKYKEMHPKTELLLYLASRCQHTYERILPLFHSKDKGIFITDRFSDSSFTYQGIGRGLPLKPLSRFNKWASFGIKPDLTILVDIPLEEEKKRKKGVPDRLEEEKEEFHKRVRQGYLKLAKRAKRRIKVFDGKRDKETLHKEIRSRVLEFLAKKGVKI